MNQPDTQVTKLGRASGSVPRAVAFNGALAEIAVPLVLGPCCSKFVTQIGTSGQCP
jgi:hypothetical protein